MDEGGSSNGVSLSKKAQCGGPLGRASLLGTPKDMLRKVLEWVSVSIAAPLLGNMEGHSFHRAFEKRIYEGGPKRNRNHSVVGEPVVVHASAARCLLREPFSISLPTGIVE
jgi:hypothetical protein